MSVIVLFSSLPADGQTLVEEMAARTKVRHADTARKVLAFYYPWYVHQPAGASSWQGVDAARKSIDNTAHFPVLGPYDSQSPEVIGRQCRWAKQADVDAWIVSWWGHGSLTDRLLPPVLDACHDAGLEATIYYETVPKPQTAHSAADDIVKLLQRYGNHPAWLTVEGKPVVFVYGRAVNELGLSGWCEAIAEVNRRYSRGVIFQGDELSKRSAYVFDGIHTYNTVSYVTGKSPNEVRSWAETAYSEWVDTAEKVGRISSLTVIPGYDDTKVRKPGLKAERFDGRSYQAQWEAAIEADPEWVLVTSWNEWFEGSEIEPSADFGEQYLQITAEMAARFKSRSPRNRPVPGPEPSGLSAEALARWKGHTIGVLPESDSLAVWSLARLPLAVRSVSWEEVAQFQADKIKELPVLLYGGEESYRRTARQPGDVEEGLLRFLRAGGLLVVLPSGPMPFHYDETHKTLVFSRRLGLPLSVAGPEGGWEHPPAGASLQFVLRDKSLAGLPEKFPFPAGGDRRWRPLVHKWLSSQDERMPLVELQDASGRSEGIAAGYIRLGAGEGRGGRVLYAWHGLMQTPQGQTLVDGLLAWLSERL